MSSTSVAMSDLKAVAVADLQEACAALADELEYLAHRQEELAEEVPDAEFEVTVEGDKIPGNLEGSLVAGLDTVRQTLTSAAALLRQMERWGPDDYPRP